MRIKLIFLSIFMIFAPFHLMAQDVNPSATYINDEGNETTTDSDLSGQAPLTVTFRANPTDMDGLNPTYEWHFRMEGEEKDFMVRYEEDTEYTFTASGTCAVTLITTLDDGEQLGDTHTIRVTVSESKLVFPNAFSPNGDDKNPTYKPMEYQSIVEFHAYIFNRWGQKLYEWTDPAADGWDGTYKGKDVKEGVYFVLVKAKGGDGREYLIRKDINLLRGYTEGISSNE